MGKTPSLELIIKAPEPSIGELLHIHLGLKVLSSPPLSQISPEVPV